MRVLALEQPDVDRQPRGIREPVEEPGGKVRLQPSRPRRREIRVRGDERLPGRLDDDHRERLVGRDDADAAPCRLLGVEQRAESLSERGSGRAHLRLGLVGRDLELQLEAPGPSELREQMVEDGDSRRDAALGAAPERNGRSALAGHRSVRSIEAPSARSRSSMRS